MVDSSLSRLDQQLMFIKMEYDNIVASVLIFALRKCTFVVPSAMHPITQASLKLTPRDDGFCALGAE